jgi:hypothetical protein
MKAPAKNLRCIKIRLISVRWGGDYCSSAGHETATKCLNKFISNSSPLRNKEKKVACTVLWNAFRQLGNMLAQLYQESSAFRQLGNTLAQLYQESNTFRQLGNTLARWLLGRSISRPPNSYTLRGMYLVGLEYPYWWIQMRNQESLLASSWTWILGSRSSVVLSACNHYKTCYKWGEDASSYVAAGKVSIVYPFQVFSRSLPLSLLITDARYPMASTI